LPAFGFEAAFPQESLTFPSLEGHEIQYFSLAIPSKIPLGPQLDPQVLCAAFSKNLVHFQVKFFSLAHLRTFHS
jgi:hypothetical protein